MTYSQQQIDQLTSLMKLGLISRKFLLNSAYGKMAGRIDRTDFWKSSREQDENAPFWKRIFG